MADVNTIRVIAEQSLEAFIRLVHPGSILGEVHKDVCRWMTREDKRSHQLLLLPRDHQKSRMAAYYAAWRITRNPAIRILYCSSTSTLAGKQVKFIKDILTLPKYTEYWPEMVNADVGAREKWTETEFSVDHPLRKQENIRDATVFSAGLTTNIVGLHCDLAILDDLVTAENAYTDIGRETVKTKYSLLASIEGADAEELAVGTRYHPVDLYYEMREAQIDSVGEGGEILDQTPLYELFERTVENSETGDGTGDFLWTRAQRADGKWFGFNAEILARKKAQYRDKTQFRAQYYNDPNDISNAPISSDFFQYYETTRLSRSDGYLFFNDRRLNVFAAVDFAYSTTNKADFTSIVVVGVDDRNNIFVLDIARFKTDRISEYFNQILRLYTKWGFRKIRAEMTSAQQVIVKDLKENYIRPYGLTLTVDDHKPTRHDGTKRERINAALQPRYANGQMWHPKGHALMTVLEEELVLENPPHDDVKDCLASVMAIVVAPTDFANKSNIPGKTPTLNFHSRFGGIS